MIHVQALDLIKEFEGCKLLAYLCPANVWTLGYGSTRINGRAVRDGDRLGSKAEAEALLISQLENEFLPKLKVIPGWGEMTEGQQSALISFAWNLGAHFYGANGFNTISLALKNKQWDSVPAAINLYHKAGGRSLAGLVRRRQAEAELWGKDFKVIDKGEQMGLNYFLDFTMGLDTDGRLEDGRLVLRSIGVSGGRTHEIWVSTTSIASRQKPEDFHQTGGPIPPEYRVPSLRSWEVETKPINLGHVKGVEGNFYKILPFTIRTDKGGVRGDFGIHRDANTPGSLGCIVMSDARFKDFESEMTRLYSLGYSKIPLFVTYSTN